MCILLLRAAPLFWEAQNLPPAPAWIQFSACYYDGCSLLKFREERDLLFFFEKSKNTSRSTKSAPTFLDFSVRTAQPCPSPTACCVPPHPLQNRVPRGERAPVALCRAGLGSRLGRCWALPTGEQHPRRQPRPSPSHDFLLAFRSFSIRSHLFATVPIPSSTQNAPGFAFFGLNRVRFSLFWRFVTAKFPLWFLCILLHGVYKLKPSVIPCKREVSFLT